jgi:hypothetical protein
MAQILQRRTPAWGDRAKNPDYIAKPWVPFGSDVGRSGKSGIYWISNLVMLRGPPQPFAPRGTFPNMKH